MNVTKKHLYNIASSVKYGIIARLYSKILYFHIDIGIDGRMLKKLRGPSVVAAAGHVSKKLGKHCSAKKLGKNNRGGMDLHYINNDSVWLQSLETIASTDSRSK